MDDNQNLDYLDRELSELVRSMQFEPGPGADTSSRTGTLVKVLKGIAAVLINVRALLIGGGD
jgi:hypothetical protein